MAYAFLTTHVSITSHNSFTLFPSDVPVLTSNLCTEGTAVLGGSSETPLKTNHLSLIHHLYRPHSHYEEDQVHFQCLVKSVFIFLSKGRAGRGEFLFWHTEPQDKECFVKLKITGHASFAALNCFHPWHFFQLSLFILLWFCSTRPDQLYLCQDYLSLLILAGKGVWTSGQNSLCISKQTVQWLWQKRALFSSHL